MFIANLNVFSCLFALSSMVMTGPIYIVISIFLHPFSASLKGYEQYIYPLSYAILAIVLAIFWWRVGLSPRTINPERKHRHRIGHWLLGSVNVATFCTLILPIVLAKLAENSNLSMLMWFSIPVYLAGFILCPIGLFMVWSSRA